MNARITYEDHEKELLAPYAQLSSASLGRRHKENECPLRTRFQRDLARVIHSTAFRRLEYKTQVFINHEDNHYRTRLTHTLEVSQIAKGLARILRLNEDLAQAIALAHDLGHSPFGHPGEEALNKLMANDGGFEHNHQSFRVVTFLEERYPDFKGLNLSFEVLEGILKHTTSYDNPKELKGFKDAGFPTLEAQLVNYADEIAFMNHDLDDGLLYGMLTIKSLKDVCLWNETFVEVKNKYPTAADKIVLCRTISGLIGRLISDLSEETRKRIKENNIKTLEDVRLKGKNIVAHTEEMSKKTNEIKNFLLCNVYRHKNVIKMNEKSTKIINGLFNAYLSRFSGKREICDHIAGLTDHMAVQEYNKIS